MWFWKPRHQAINVFRFPTTPRCAWARSMLSFGRWQGTKVWTDKSSWTRCVELGARATEVEKGGCPGPTMGAVSVP